MKSSMLNLTLLSYLVMFLSRRTSCLTVLSRSSSFSRRGVTTRLERYSSFRRNNEVPLPGRIREKAECWIRPTSSWHSTRLATATSLSSAIEDESLILEGLNPSQVEAVTQPTAAVTRVIAGPGSGKTRVLTCRVAYLLSQDYRSRVLAVTFTKKAAEEMRQRVETLLVQQEQKDNGEPTMQESGVISEDQAAHIPKDLARVTMGTFHSICAKILRFNGDLLETLPSIGQDMVGLGQDSAVNLDGNFAIADTSDQLRILKECIDEAEIDLAKAGVKPLQVLTSIGTIKEANSQGKDPFAEYTGNNSKKKVMPKPLRFAKEVYGLYRQKLLSNNALDFDDLIYMTREMLLMYPNLRERLHRRWPHVLVDEFQDTSIAQMDLVKLLTFNSLFVVGDADQSIYAWRGAHAGSLSDFGKEFEEFSQGVGVHTVYLKENYRSTSNIVKAAEKVISAASSTAKSDDPRQAMKPQRGSGPSPRIVACADEKAEAQFVVDNIVELIADSSLTSDSTVAVIFRTNAQSRFLEEACVSKNIPYVIRGGAGGFYKRAEVKDTLCFLRWMYNGNDESAMIRAFRTPSRGLGDKAIAAFKDYCNLVDTFYRESLQYTSRPSKLDILISMAEENGSLDEGAPSPADSIPKRALNNFLPFGKQMKILLQKAYKSPVDSLMFDIIGEFDLFSHFDSISKSKAEFEERRENVQELRRATRRYSKQGPALTVHTEPQEFDSMDSESPLGTFLDDVALVSDVKVDEENGGSSHLVVNLMTIHASKGTEYDAVFLVGNEEGTLPSNLSIQEGEDSVALQEERRLCYVAMTRAKTRLIMTWRKEVTTYSGWSADGPKTVTRSRSRFLDALVKKSSSKKLAAAPSGSSKTAKTGTAPRQRRHVSSSAMSPSASSLQELSRRPEITRRSPSLGGHRNGSSETRASPSIRSQSSTKKAKSPSSRTTTSKQAFSKQVQRESTTNSSSEPAPMVSPAPSFDSTIFYPVGSDVTHNNFGKGKVLEPPPPTEDTKSMVRVQFDNGRTMEFPVETRDLLPIF